MKVEFKFGWFGPDAVFYDKGVQEVPDNLYDVLPSSAKLVSVEPVKVEVAPKSVSLKDFDDLRSETDVAAALLTKFEKEKVK